MKKALTFIAAVVLMASASFAQPKVLPGRAVKNNPLVKTASTTRTHQAASMLTLPKKAHFAKAAGDTISTFPWEEGFENGTTGWTIIENDNDGICWQLSDTCSQFDMSDYPRSGNACIAAFSYDNFTHEALTPDEWLISPALEIPAGSAFVLSFYDNGTNPQYAAEHYTVHIATSNTPTALGATTPVMEQTLSTGNWTKRSIDLSAYAGQTVYIGFHHFGCTDQFCLGIDDIRVGNSAPDVTLNGPSMAFANEPVTFVAVSSVTNLAWAVDGTAQAETGDTLVYTFTAAGTYAVSVTATNAAGVSSSDSILVSVIECNDITMFPYLLDADVDSMLYCVKIIDADGDGNNWTISSENGLDESNALYSASYASGALTPDNWLILPGMNLPDTATDFILSWYEKAYSSSYAADFYSVYICNTGNDTSDFLATTPIYSDSMSADWAKHGISLANYTNQTIYIAFRHYNCTDQWAMMLDNIRVGGPEAPEVSVNGPEMVRINEPYTFTATSDVTPITWIVDGDTLTETGNTLTYTFTTTGSHTVVVSATNNVGTSTDTLSINAIECLAQTLPFESNFAAETTIGFCWDNPNEGWSLGQLQTSGDVVVYSQSSLYGMFALDPDNWLVTPTLTMPESGDYQIEYEIIGWLDHYTIYIIQGTDTTALFNETLPEDMADFEPRAVLIPNTVTGNFKVAIRHHESLEGYQLILAYLNVKEQGAPSVIVRGPAEIEKGEAATFTAVSGTATSYAWTVDGTAQNTTGNTLTYTFTTTGNHTVSVIASNNFGSSQPATHTVNVYSCNDPIIPLPWTESFEGSVDCWTFIADDEDGFEVNGDYPNLAADGSNFLVGWTPSTANANQWAISMPFTMPANVTDAKLSWVIASNHQSATTISYEVLVTTQVANPNPDYFSTVLFSESASTGNANENRQVSLSSMAGKTFRIAFRNTTAAGGALMILDNIKIASPTGINNVNNINVSIYPNPASDKLNIEGEGIQMVEMFDLNGRSVLTSQRAGQIDLSNLSEGVYVVRVIAADGVRTEKIVKK